MNTSGSVSSLEAFAQITEASGYPAATKALSSGSVSVGKWVEVVFLVSQWAQG
jgi:hypothetical protein